MSFRRMMLATLGAYVQGLIDAFKARVLAFPGIFEAEACLKTQLDAVNDIGLLQDATIVITPNGYNENILHTVKGNTITAPPYNLSQYTETTTLWQGGQAVLSTNTIDINPFGVMSSVRLQEAANTNVHVASNNIAAVIVLGRTYTFSVYFKKGTGATAPDIIQLTAVAGIGAAYANFNITTGIVTLTSGCTATITSAPNGWWRCSITATAVTAPFVASGLRIYFCNNNPLSALAPSYLGATTSNIFFIGTQIEESPVMTTYQPVIFTRILEQGYAQHTRSTTAYKVDSDGSVNEVPQQNLGPIINNYSYVSCTREVENAIAPNGLLEAIKITQNTGGARVRVTTANYYATTPVDNYVFSVYLKAGTGSTPSFTDAGFSAVFNLSTGIITSTSGCTATITDVGNGWYRCAAYISNLSIPNIQINTNVGNGFFFYAWGAQIVRGTVLTTYYPTITRTNTPRIDYTDGSCPTLLLEWQAQNRITRSSEFNNALWIKSNISVTQDTDIAPNGLLEADTITATANDGIIRQNMITGAASISIFSIYLKRKTGTGDITIQTGNQSSIVAINSLTWTRVWLLNTNNNGTYSAASGVYTITTILPHNLTNGDLVFVDCVGGGGADHSGLVTVTGPNTFTTTFGAVSTGGANVNVYAIFARIKFQTSGDEVYAWGAQFESIPSTLQSGYYEPTSYIPTTTAAVTRGVDIMSLFKIRENNLLNNTWSVFCDVKKIGGNQNDAIIGISDSISATPTNGIIVSGVPLFVTKRDAGVTTTVVPTTVYQPSATAYFKILITCNNGIVETWIDGSKLSTTTLVNYQLLTLLESIANNGISRYKQVLGWNRVLNRAEIDLLFAYPYFNAGYTPVNNELQQTINRANAEGFTIPNATILGYCDTLITEMKNDGVWTITDKFFNFAYNDVSLLNWSRIDLRNPNSKLNGICILYGTTNYRVDGFKGNGTNAYIDTLFNPSSAINIPYNYTLNNAGRLLVISEDATGGFVVYEGNTGTSTRMMPYLANLGAFTSNSFNSAAATIDTRGIGLKSIMRDTSTNIRIQNGVNTLSTTQTSVAITNNNQLLLRVASTYSNGCISNYWIGASLTNLQIANFRTYYNTYLTNIGLTAFA